MGPAATRPLPRPVPGPEPRGAEAAGGDAEAEAAELGERLLLVHQALAELLAHLGRDGEALTAGAALDDRLVADGDGRQGVEGDLALGAVDGEEAGGGALLAGEQGVALEFDEVAGAEPVEEGEDHWWRYLPRYERRSGMGVGR